MILKSSFIAYIVITFAILVESAKHNGFSVDLIHRDSPQSPLYDSNLAHSERLVNALRRSLDRVKRFKAGLPTRLPQTSITSSDGEYLMKYSIGSPPVPSLGIADTGSDITWTQCQPCRECFNQTLPIFDTKKSSTYKRLPCNDPYCTSFEGSFCSKSKKYCLYSGTYGDGSFTNGELSTETISLGSTKGGTLSFPNITIGCGFQNGGIFNGGESGIVGLGVGKASLIKQLGHSIDEKFSYCLVPISVTPNVSKLNFGASSEVSGRGVVSTPMILDQFYTLTLEGITVGNQHLELYDDPSDPEEDIPDTNIIIDSGTTLTILPSALYNKVENAVKSYVKLKQVPDPKGILNLCYLTQTDIQKPDITIHFKGADVDLKPENVFVRLNKTIQCLAFKGDTFPIYGNLAQTNFLIGYDLTKNRINAIDTRFNVFHFGLQYRTKILFNNNQYYKRKHDKTEMRFLRL